jgi:predicted dehydrogenase
MMDAMKDLKAAVIGTGGAARLHMQAYGGGADTQPVAVCSGGRKRAEEFAAEFGVRAYTSVAEMLERERPDVVSVATLEWDHETPVLLSLEAGCHVLCEKIMAHEIAIGERMVAAARHAGKSLGVNFNYRFVPAHRLIKEELERGGFGAPALFSANMHAYLWPHLLDLLRFFFGDPAEVTGAMVDDQALRPAVSAASGRPWIFTEGSEMLCHPSIAVAATFRFRNPDFVATMSGSAFVPLERHFWSFALYGRDEAVKIDGATRANLNGVASLGAVNLGQIAERIAALPACSYAESFELSVGGFVESVRLGRPVPVTGEDGLAEMRLDAAVVEAIRTVGRWDLLEGVLEGRL